MVNMNGKKNFSTTFGNMDNEELKHTTAGKFNELGKAISDMGASCEEFTKTVQWLGDKLNSVPPYPEDARPSKVNIFHAIKTAAVIMAILSVIAWLLHQL